MYSLLLKDEDFVPITLQRNGNLKLTVLYPDGSIMRRLWEPSEGVDTHYAFTAGVWLRHSFSSFTDAL